MKRRRLLFRALAVLILVATAGVMLVIGRGHTVYLDNKTLQYNGQTCQSAYRMEIAVGGQPVARLEAGDRGQAVCVGQTLQMLITVTPQKDGEPVAQRVTMRLPYHMDGIILNLPGLLAGLPPDAYLSEFVPALPKEEADETVVTDEFALPAEG